ncbi:hypothetical protein EMCRGX_G034190 [Ephydatia muelleri]
MSSEQEIIRVGRQLEKIANSDTPNDEAALDLLKSLQGLPMTLDLLQKSRVGLSVNKIRKKCDGTDLSTVAKKLIKSWKKLVPSTAGTPPSPVGANKLSLGSPSVMSPPPVVEYPAVTTPTPVKSKHSSVPDVLSSPVSNGLSCDLSGGGGLQRSMSTTSNDSEVPEFSSSVKGESRVASSGDPSRDKCRELLTKALQKGYKDITIVEETKFHNLGAQIEQCIFAEFKDTGNKYKMRIRSRVANLGDPKNPELRRSVICGEISVGQISTMTAEQMASDSLKNLRQKLTTDAIRDAQISAGGGTKTDLLKCSKCKKRNCSYTQAQTRSADEPMTTFAYCNDCGHRWKFC